MKKYKAYYHKRGQKKSRYPSYKVIEAANGESATNKFKREFSPTYVLESISRYN